MTDFSGTGVALVTPMNDDGAVDWIGLERLIHHVTDHVNYLVVLGTTGESPTIYPEERDGIVNFVIEKNKGRLPIVVGFSGNFTDNLVRKIASLKNPGIDGILISSPHYNKPSQEGIVAHYQAVADVSDYPIILYNVPHRTSSNMSADTTLALAKHPMIVAMKEASCDLEQCKKIAESMPEDFLLLSGDDALTADIINLGGAGVISVVANGYPELMSTLVTKARSGKAMDDEASATLDRAIELSGAEGNPTSIKGALKALGICEGYTRLPITPPSPDLIKKFGEIK